MIHQGIAAPSPGCAAAESILPAGGPDTLRRDDACARPVWLDIANLALTVFCGLVVAATLAVTIGPRLLTYETLIVRSGSMAPAIPTGAVVVVQPVQPREVRVGDVITYRRPERPDIAITHRVVEVQPAPGQGAGALTGIPVFRTKGDANGSVDPWEVQLQGIAWRVALSVPLAGYLFVFAQSPVGRTLLLILPSMALLLLWIERTWRSMRSASRG
jgi:signal peptidase